VDSLSRRRSGRGVGTITRSEQSALFRRRNNAEYVHRSAAIVANLSLSLCVRLRGGVDDLCASM
jgi:hypothetical protein